MATTDAATTTLKSLTGAGSNGPSTSITPDSTASRSLTTGSQGYTQFGSTDPTTASATSDPALGDINSDASSTLSDYLKNNPESSQESGIIDRYNTAVGGINTAAGDTAESIGDYYNENLADTQRQNTSDVTSAKEAQAGFATNTAALTNIQATGAKRIRDLTNSRDAALLTNNADQAKSLSDLIMQEQTNITTARQNWVQNLLALTTTQAPEKAAVLQFATQYPGAGILPSDTMAQASAKAQASPLYKANLSQINANASAASASAASSAATAANTRTLTGFLTPTTLGASDPDVASLINHSATPEQIQAKYPVSLFGGKAASVISSAQANGYSLNQGTLTGDAQKDQVSAQNSGNPLQSVTSWLSSFGVGAGKALTAPAAAAPQVTPSGIKFTITP
jgi:hypothetical protein